MNACPSCGTPVRPKTVLGGAPKIYCSRTCQQHRHSRRALGLPMRPDSGAPARTFEITPLTVAHTLQTWLAEGRIAVTGDGRLGVVVAQFGPNGEAL